MTKDEAKLIAHFASRADCGDNSCWYKAHGKHGMRTNGGCRCLPDGGQLKWKRIVEEARLICGAIAPGKVGDDPGRRPMTDHNGAGRHAHSVVNAAATIAGLVSGSHGELVDEQERELARWLRWRITDGWCYLGLWRRAHEFEAYDEAVRSMAERALELYERHRR